MYKSPLDNFNDFYNQVFEKETASKQNNSKVEKSYFEYKTENVDLRIPHDTVVHVENGHGLQLNEWADFFNNISTPTDIAISNKPRYDGSPLLLKYNINGKTYGAVIEFFENKKPILTTVFSDTEKKVSDWIKENSHSQAKNTSSVTAKGMLLSNDYNSILSYFKNKLNPSRQDVYQTQNIQDNFGQSVEELQEMFGEDIKNILAENEINSDEFEIEDVRLYGSYTTGKNKDTSDLDVIVQYKGSMKEDTAFNILNDAKLTITDVNGIERKIDINPINSRLSGSIDEHIERMQEIDGAYFQSAVTAGAETSAKISDAQKEWQEKGTDSKYFKKWFGDSKVVDENGQPLVVYHGTLEKFNKFDKNSIGNRFSYDERGFFFTSSKNIANDYSTSEFDSSRKGYVMPVYISAKTPLVIDEKFLKKEGMGGVFKQEDSISFWDNYQDFVLDTFDEGNYDGIIINDGDTKMVVAFEPTQIKSVDNQGTFDEGNPNIYYQTGINQGEITNIDGSIVKDVSNPLDYDYLNNQVTGEKVAIEINQDIKVEEIKPQNISSDLPFNVSKKTSENKKAIKQILNIDKGKILNLTNSATNESVEFKGTTIDESISKISINDGRYNDCCLILCNSKKLFETSQKILSHNDVKKVSDLKYSRYANIAQINDKQYLLEFVIKEKNKLALYSITPIKNDIAKRVDKSSQHDIAINSIAHIQDVFKSKIVQQYNNDYKNAYKNNNPKRTGYVFQEPAQPNLFVENAAQNHNKGFVGIDLKGNRGLTDINRNLILIGTTGDITTVLHESAHYFLNMLEELERVPDHSPKVDDVLFAIRKTLKNDGTPFTRSQHEKFAKGFEHYIYTGNTRSNIFKEIYEDIKNLLKNIYEFVQKGQYFTTGEGALTEEEMKNFNNVFDEIFKLKNKTVKERVFAKVLALNEKEEDGFFKELTLFLSLFW